MRHLATLVYALEAGHFLTVGVTGLNGGEQVLLHGVLTVLALALAVCAYARIDPGLPDRLERRRRMRELQNH